MTPETVKASYRRVLRERITIRRYTGSTANQPRFDAENIRARTVGYAPNELVGSIVQGDRKIIVATTVSPGLSHRQTKETPNYNKHSTQLAMLYPAVAMAVHVVPEPALELMYARLATPSPSLRR